MGSFWRKIGGVAVAVTILVAPLSSISAHTESQHNAPAAVDGVLDLREWDFNSSGAIALDGEWNFFWREFVSPQNISAYEGASKVSVPHDWRESEVNGNGDDGTGFGTYHLQILLPENAPQLALEIGSLYHTYKIFLNGDLLVESGEPGSDAESEASIPVTWHYTPLSSPAQASDSLNLVVQLSNFIHAEGGIRQSIVIGDAKNLKRSYDIRWAALVLLIGAAMALAFYHFSLYFARKRDWVFMSFGGLLVAIAVHGTCTLGMVPLPNGIDWNIAALTLKLEYLAIVLGSVTGVNFVWRLYPQVCWKPAQRAFVVYGILIAAFTVLVEPVVFTKFLPVYKTGMLLAIATTIVSVAIAAFKRLQGSYLFLLGVLVLGIGVGSGIVGHTASSAAAGIKVYFSISFLILAQGVIVGRRVTTAFQTSERLRADLARANLELEDQVEERTKLLKQSTEEAHLAKEEAIRANRVKSEFLAMMSHEIRTPLNGVLGMAGLLAKSELTEDQQSKLEAIRQSGDDLLYLLNDILDYSKIEAGQMKLEAREFDLAALIDRCARLWKPQAESKGLKFNLERNCPDEFFVIGDDHRLLQITSNLVSNAIKFTSQGNITLNISVTSRDWDTSKIRISVTDSGTGIPLEAQSGLFSSFVQGDLSITRKYGGSGLGLTICKRLVEMMDGTIEFWSREGKGSKFWVDIALPEAQSLADSEDHRIDSAPVRLTQRNILVVDDNEINRRLASELLRAVGHTVETAVNGYEAVQIVVNSPPNQFDAILMDVHMPKMNGLDATKEIRAHFGNETLPIIGLTADAMTGDREKILGAGMSAYVAKPIEPEDLFAAIEETCAHAKAIANQASRLAG